jgi:arabinan endo-1,5-alpha-L-arabinosidase
VKGPYLDKEGVALSRGGGSILLQGDKEWHGVGHNGVAAADGRDYIVYHGYDAADGGKSKLQVQELKWDPKGWPYLEEISTGATALGNKNKQD